jgi:hypothetical protein
MSQASLAAFPSNLSASVNRLASLLEPPCEIQPCGWFSVSCANETLTIPGRIYCSPPTEAEFRALQSTEQTIVACWFTRHHDGHVRERFVRTVEALDRGWVIAYVVALCGEYVIELLYYVWERHDLFDRPALGGWLLDNQPFYARTRSRIVSYWHCYNRSSLPRFSDYVGSRIISFFDECIKIAASGSH